jgi:hypothetical protein
MDAKTRQPRPRGIFMIDRLGRIDFAPSLGAMMHWARRTG